MFCPLPILPSMTCNVWMEIIPQLGARLYNMQSMAGISCLMESRRVKRAKHGTQYWFFPTWKKSKSSSFQRTMPGNLMGSWETNGSSQASRFTPTFTVADISYWFVTFLHQQDRTGKTQHTHTPTTYSTCWQIRITPRHARSLSRKRRKALNRAWLSLSYWGKSSSSRQQDLFVKGEHFPAPGHGLPCSSLFIQAHPFFHSLA